jgi:hypothetical protein
MGAAMSYSSIMVHVTPSAHASGRIKLAGALADRFGAALIGNRRKAGQSRRRQRLRPP